MYSGERKLIRPGIHPLQALPRRRYRRRAGIYAHGGVFHSEGSRREMPQLVGAAAIQVGRLLHPLLRHHISAEAYRAQDAPRRNGQQVVPFGDTAVAFSGATVLHKEFGKTSPWISVAGYAVATVTAVDRVRRNRHHWDDVAAGAAIGFLSAQASYWLVDKITGSRKKKDAEGKPVEEEQKVQIGVGADGLAMVIKL